MLEQAYIQSQHIMSSTAPKSPDSSQEPSLLTPKPPQVDSKLLYAAENGLCWSSFSTPRRLGIPQPRLNIRTRLHQYNTIDDAVSLLKSAKNIVVLTGAGISTSLGIPDFRSSQGLYHILKASTDYDDPQELFHIENFYNDPAKFYKNVAPIIPQIPGCTRPSVLGDQKNSQKSTSQVHSRYSPTHAFLALLQAKDKLLTNYTQNIDGLEMAAGVISNKIVQCHGTWATATCISCNKKSSARKYLPVVYANGVPFCKCSSTPALRNPSKTREKKKSKKRKRHEYEDTESSEDNNTMGQPGLLKPDITFFGEQISESYRPRIESDKKEVDLLLIIGTSLKVAPVNEMLTLIPNHVPQLWISKDRCQRDGVKVDIELLGECDVIVQELCRRAGWTNSLERRVWKREQLQQQETLKSNHEADRDMPLRKKEPLNLSHGGSDGKIKSISAKSQNTSSKDENLSKSTKNQEAEKSIVRPISNLAENSKTPNQDTTKSKVLREDQITSNPIKDETRKICRENNKMNVIIELEEGTENRWFIKRSK